MRIDFADAGRRASSDAGKAWRTAAQAGLSGLLEKGILLEPEPVLERLGALAALLRPGEAPALAEEPSTPFSESSSRLSFSRDRRWVREYMKCHLLDTNNQAISSGNKNLSTFAADSLKFPCCRDIKYARLAEPHDMCRDGLVNLDRSGEIWLILPACRN